MPVNDNVSGVGSQITPTAEDYFIRYPEMRKQVTVGQVTSIIGGRSSSWSDWTRGLKKDDPRFKIEKRNVAAISKTVAKASELLDSNFRAWCDENWERLSGDYALQGFCEMLHTVVCKVWLDISVTNGMKVG